MTKAKRAVSLLLLLLLTAACFFLAGNRLPHGEIPAEKPAVPSKKSFHALERPAEGEQKALDQTCSACHGQPAHKADPRTRAFANLHTGPLPCLVCHGRGEGLTISKNAASAAPKALWVGKPIEPPQVAGRVHSFPGGLAFLPKPPPCVSCHSRGSAFFASNRYYDEYRRRLLEDLDVLPLMGEPR